MYGSLTLLTIFTTVRYFDVWNATLKGVVRSSVIVLHNTCSLFTFWIEQIISSCCNNYGRPNKGWLASILTWWGYCLLVMFKILSTNTEVWFIHLVINKPYWYYSSFQVRLPSLDGEKLNKKYLIMWQNFGREVSKTRVRMRNSE